jgi:hypothetical protein
MATVESFFTERGFAVALWNNVVLVDTSIAIDVMRTRRLRSAYSKLLQTYPRTVGLSVLHAGTPISSSEARSESARLFADLGDKLAHVAVVSEDTGVFAVLLRTVVRSFSALSHSRISLHGDIESALLQVLPFVISDAQPRSMHQELVQAMATTRNHAAQSGAG